jgi:signal transduction histidine kinase
MATPARRSWDAVLRLLARDERVFAVLLAVVMVGGLATLGLAPLRARHGVDIYSLVMWFAAYKLGIFALVTVSPQATRGIFIGALGVDLLLVFALVYLTGGGDSPFVNLFYPAVAINAYYFGRWVGLFLTLVAGLLYWTAARLATPDAAWTAVAILMGQVGLPAYALGHVAERERRSRAEVERLNLELTGTLTRLRAAQEKLVEADRMATVGRLSLKIAHEVRNPISAIGLNAELLGDIVRERLGGEIEEAGNLVGAIREQVTALDALTEEYLAFARFPRAQFAVRGGLGQRYGHGCRRIRQAAGGPSREQRHGEHRADDPADGDRQDAPASGRAQPDQEWPRGLVQGRDALRHDAAARWHRRDRRERYGARYPARGGPPSLRAVLHHEAAGHRSRAFHLPPDRGRAWRPDPLDEHTGRGDDVHRVSAHQESRPCLIPKRRTPRCWWLTTTRR